jgi:hypothetical protein
MTSERAKRFITKWMVPQGVWDAYRLHASARVDPTLGALLAKNASLRGAHAGQRCFVLGCGPSMAQQDLIPLRDETCIALNGFYRHADIHLIAPRYYLFSGATIHTGFTREMSLNWYREMDQRTGKGTLLLNCLDRPLIEENGLLRGRTVFYFAYRGPWQLLMDRGIDATGALYSSQNVAVMAIQAAIYMGCTDIVLLGLDHDWLLESLDRPSTHFYTPEECVVEGNVLPNGQNGRFKSDFECYFNQWNQYETLKGFAEKSRIRIRNATRGGLLDVFERVEFEEVIDSERH